MVKPVYVQQQQKGWRTLKFAERQFAWKLVGLKPDCSGRLRRSPVYYSWHGYMEFRIYGDWMAAAYKLLSFTTVILAVSPYCIIDGCEVVRSDLLKSCHWDQRYVFPGAGERNMAGATWAMMTYQFWQLMWKHQIAKFLAKTLRVCGGLVVLTYCTLDRGGCCFHWRGEL